MGDMGGTLVGEIENTAYAYFWLTQDWYLWFRGPEKNTKFENRRYQVQSYQTKDTNFESWITNTMFHVCNFPSKCPPYILYFSSLVWREISFSIDFSSDFFSKVRF